MSPELTLTAPAGKRHRAGYVTVLIGAAVIAAAGCVSIVAGHPLAALPSFLTAAFAVVSALLIRVNWRLIEVNRTLIAQNASLVERARQACRADRVPGSSEEGSDDDGRAQ